MHRRVLCGGYDLAATDLRLVLDEGRFNCVSATVLFNYFGGALGLKCQGLEMPSHAMSRVLLPEGAIDVDTTCPRWFHLADNPQQRTAAASKTIGAAAWADRSKAREVSPIQLAAMIYYNRGVEALRHNDFELAIARNRLALLLDSENTDARGNLLSAINKRALELTTQKKFAAAIELVERGLRIEPSHAPLRQNRLFIDRVRQQAQADAG
jgi:tetratricopeptide (TPR) repeat protein